MRLTIVAGARPNFIKIAPLIHELERQKALGKDISYRLVHTGQHYNSALSDIFFEQLEIPRPHANLEVGSGSQAEQTGRIMTGFEKELVDHPSDLVIVVGDVNSTMAAAIVAKKLQVKVAHIEAGIRSFDLSMPEEINRMVTDAISDYFFTTTLKAGDNLLKAGIEDSRIFFVGNIMIDSLLKYQAKFSKPAVFKENELENGNYFLLTLHRPSNVDDKEQLRLILDIILENSGNNKVVFPVHPRTLKNLDVLKLSDKRLVKIDPLSYFEFNYLVQHAKAVITDSGGIQEETTVLGIPCITVRANTERPETVEIGTNILTGSDPFKLKEAIQKVQHNNWKQSSIPALWDGHTAERIVQQLLQLNQN